MRASARPPTRACRSSSPIRARSPRRRFSSSRARSTRRGAPASRRRFRLSPDEARGRLAALGFDDADVEVLADHFMTAESTGRAGHGVRRIEWLETWPELHPEAKPRRAVSEPGYERWEGNGALGYLVLAAAIRAQLVSPPEHARVVVCDRTFPTGMLGHWARKLADGGLVAVLTATSPPRLG